MRRDAFSALNPIVVFAYFAAVITLSMLLISPVCLVLSCVCSIVYGIYLRGFRQAAFNLKIMLPTALTAALINVLFNHRGMTVLCFFPSGNALTLESVYYGLAMGAMIIAAVNWFSCLNAVLTSEKLSYLLGRIMPSLALVFSMILRFVPRFTEQYAKAAAAQTALYGEPKSFLQRLKRAVKISSIVLTWAFESSIDTADSMKARGYGSTKRSAYALYRWRREDTAVLAVILAGVALTVTGYINGALYFAYTPRLYGETGIRAAVHTAVYGLMSAVPMIINAAEEVKWRRLLS